MQKARVCLHRNGELLKVVLLNDTHAWHFTGLYISSNVIRLGLALLLSICLLDQIDQSCYLISQCGRNWRFPKAG